MSPHRFGLIRKVIAKGTVKIGIWILIPTPRSVLLVGIFCIVIAVLIIAVVLKSAGRKGWRRRLGRVFRYQWE
jgi:hypothetical protein